MKKPLALMLLAALTLALLAGCGAQTAPAPMAAPAVTAAPPAETPAPTEAPAPETVTVRIGALTGPTAMGMAKLLHDAAQGRARTDMSPFWRAPPTS
jgi:NitT/TauT family transport system substrate-binding protein